MARSSMNLLHILMLTCMLPALNYARSFQDEQQLKDKLLQNYDNEIRPYPSFGIYISIILFSLNKLSVEEQEMSVTAVIYSGWHDVRLIWNSSEHAGIESIMLYHGRIWQPRFYVENSVNEIRALGDEEKGPLRVYSSGIVKWMIPVVIRVFCEVEIVAFPFDRQECTINIYTWGFDITEIFMAFTDKVNLDFFKKNGEWDLIDTIQYSTNDTDNEEVYQKMKIQLRMRRKWLFLCMTMLVPAVLNSVLMGAVFALPFESGEKMSYSLTVLLTYIVLLTLVAESLPPISTEISALQIYLSSVMCMGTIATLLTVWTVNIYNQNPEKPRPPWLVFFTVKVCKYLACAKIKPEFSTSKQNDISGSRLSDGNKKYEKTAASEHTSYPSIQNKHFRGNDRHVPRSILTPYVVSLTDVNAQHISEASHLNNSSVVDSDGEDSRRNCLEQVINSRSPDDDEIDPRCITWVQIADVMDSLFLRIVSSVIFLGTVALITFLSINY